MSGCIGQVGHDQAGQERRKGGQWAVPVVKRLVNATIHLLHASLQSLMRPQSVSRSLRIICRRLCEEVAMRRIYDAGPNGVRQSPIFVFTVDLDQRSGFR
jgi:hypothetical protein